MRGTDMQLCGSLGAMLYKKKKVVQCDGKKGSKVFVKIPGSGKILTICELQIFGKAAPAGNDTRRGMTVRGRLNKFTHFCA